MPVEAMVPPCGRGFGGDATLVSGTVGAEFCSDEESSLTTLDLRLFSASGVDGATGMGSAGPAAVGATAVAAGRAPFAPAGRSGDAVAGSAGSARYEGPGDEAAVNGPLGLIRMYLGSTRLARAPLIPACAEWIGDRKS